MHFVSTTQIQRNPKSVFGKEPFQIILSNNKPQGMLLSQEVTEYLEKSGILQQIQEELWEISDSETCDVIQDFRQGGKKDSLLFKDMKK
jgi:hypothetical protein